MNESGHRHNEYVVTKIGAGLSWRSFFEFHYVHEILMFRFYTQVARMDHHHPLGEWKGSVSQHCLF